MPKHVPPPLTSSAQWKLESTPGGKSLLSPTSASFDAAGVYEPPAASRSRSHSHSHHDHDHDHHGHDHHDHAHHEHNHHNHPHGHSAKRSRFTSFLLAYTSRWPMLHTIMTDKDSRRIFYFMRFVAAPRTSAG